jgi:hypothetical protein
MTADGGPHHPGLHCNLANAQKLVHDNDGIAHFEKNNSYLGLKDATTAIRWQNRLPKVDALFGHNSCNATALLTRAQKIRERERRGHFYCPDLGPIECHSCDLTKGKGSSHGDKRSPEYKVEKWLDLIRLIGISSEMPRRCQVANEKSDNENPDPRKNGGPGKNLAKAQCFFSHNQQLPNPQHQDPRIPF